MYSKTYITGLRNGVMVFNGLWTTGVGVGALLTNLSSVDILAEIYSKAGTVANNDSMVNNNSIVKAEDIIFIGYEGKPSLEVVL